MEGVTYERMDGVDAGHGQKFEWETTTLAYLRCQKLHEQWKKDNRNGIKSFSVANNVKDAGNFDDIVIRVEYVVDSQIRNKVIFVQCKHIEDPSKNSKKRFQEYLTKTKSLRDLFDSFVKIEQRKDQAMKELLSDEPIDTKQNIRLQQDGGRNNLRSFFLFKDIDTEFVFCSNIVIEPDFETKLYKSGAQNRKKEDIVDILFNTANTARFELHLEESDSAQAIFGINTKQDACKPTDFYEKFRVFVNQTEPETLILQELQSITNIHLDTEYLKTLITEEIQNHFTSESPCTALTEKSNTIAHVRNFMMIRKKSAAVKDEFCKNLRTQNVFSGATISQLQKQLKKKEIAIIETNFQKLEIIKLKQVFYSSSIESTSLVLQSENDRKEWMSARETIHYSHLKVNVCSQNNVNIKKVTLKSNETIGQISECNEQQSTISEYLEQFSEETKNFILNANIKFQGFQLKVKSLCGESWKYFFDENIVCKILQKEKVELCKPLPDLGFYIERHFQSKSLNSDQIKKKTQGWTSSDTGIFLFSENDKYIPGHQGTYKRFDNMQDVRTFVRELVGEIQDTYHLCSYHKSELKLIYSFGKSSALIAKNTNTQDFQLNDTCTKITIISDVAGMGKTKTLLALAEIDKKNNPSYWVFFIELNKYLEPLKLAEQLSSTDSTIQFIGSKILQLNEIELTMFTDACNKSGKVALYIDAFDEISPDAEKTLLLLLLTLERTKISRIFVSSRPNYAQVLEQTILKNAVNFVGFTKAEKEFALEGYWEQMLLKEDKQFEENLLKEKAQQTVEALEREKHLLSDILAIPLQIRMIATIYYDSLIKLNEEQIPELSKISLSNLYEDFINLHARRFYVDKHKMQWTSLKDDQKYRIVKEKLRGAEKMACHTIIPKFVEYSEENMNDVVSSLCDDLGLITNKNPPVFLHRTIAEYLAAKYVLTKINDDFFDERLQSVLKDFSFQTVRKFLNSLLVDKQSKNFCKKDKFKERRNYFEKTPLHTATIEDNVEIMRFLLTRDEYLLNMRNEKERTCIFFACMNGKTEAMKLLLTHSDCSVNIADKDGNTVLHAATTTGSTEMTATILQREYSLLNKKNKTGNTPLHLLCSSGYTEAAILLLEHSDCSVNLINNDGDTVLHAASVGGITEVIDIILRRDHTLLNKQNKKGETPLHLACLNGKIEAVNLLLSQPDCTINICDKEGNTVLHKATNSKEVDNFEIVSKIFEFDISLINRTNKKGQTSLHYACSRGHTESVKLFLEHPKCSIDIIDNDHSTVLHSASQGGCIEAINIILRRDREQLNKQNKRNETSLHLACSSEKTEVAKILLTNCDCSVNICDKNLNTVLHTAVYKGLIEIIELILQRDYKTLNIKNKNGATPMHFACLSRKTATAKLLLAHHYLDGNICDNDGNTILHEASGWGCDVTVKKIMRRFPSLLNKQNKSGETALHFACISNETEVAKLLLEQADCSVNICSNDDESALHYASESGCTELIEIILQRDPDLVNKKNKNEETPLYLAFYKGKTEAAKLLLEQSLSDCSISKCDEYGDSVLHVAVASGRTELIEIILGRNNNLINKQNEKGETPLHRAFEVTMYANQTAKLLLMQSECSVGICDYNGNTVLHSASMTGLTDIMEIIIRRDNSLLDKQNKKGRTPLHTACLNGKTQAAKVLLKHSNCSVNISDIDGNTALHCASYKGFTEIMDNILGFDDTSLHKQNKKGETPLLRACSCGQTEAAKLLLSYSNYQATICDNDGNTVLHTASFVNCIEVMEMLIRRDKYLLSKQNKSGETPLHHALSNCKTEAAKLLLKHKNCPITLCNDVGDTVLHVASYNGCLEIIEILLLRDDSLLNKQNKNGETSLQCACFGGKSLAVKMLLSYSHCSVNTRDVNGLTALDVASKNGHCEIVELLLEHSAQ